MRKFTKNPAVGEKPRLTVRDMGRTAIFRMEHGTGWYRRTDEAERPAVSIEHGTLQHPPVLNRVVTEVLAPDETLTIGPEVE